MKSKHVPRPSDALVWSKRASCVSRASGVPSSSRQFSTFRSVRAVEKSCEHRQRKRSFEVSWQYALQDGVNEIATENAHEDLTVNHLKRRWGRSAVSWTICLHIRKKSNFSLSVGKCTVTHLTEDIPWFPVRCLVEAMCLAP